jgi:hypothetical protein
LFAKRRLVTVFRSFTVAASAMFISWIPRTPTRYDCTMEHRSTSFVRWLSLALVPLAFSLTLVGGACSTFSGDDEPLPNGDASSPLGDAPSTNDGPSNADAAKDAGPCDLAAPWGAPVPLANVNGLPATTLGIPSPDERVMFTVAHSDLGSRQAVYTSLRTNLNQDFSGPSLLPGGLSGVLPYNSIHPSINVSGTELYYERQIAGDGTGSEIYVSTRSNVSQDFPAGSLVALMRASVTSPLLAPGGLSLYFSHDDKMGNLSDLYVAKRASLTEPFTTSTRLEIASTLDSETHPVPSADELTLYFARRAAPGGKTSLWMASRTDQSATFGTPKEVTELSTEEENLPTGLSADGCRIYLTTKSAVADSKYVIQVAKRP